MYNEIMIELNIPGWKTLQLEHLVTDVNGTIAVDGQLIDGLGKIITQIQDRLVFYMLTADTHGQQRFIDERLNIQATIIQRGHEAEQKAEFVRDLGAESVVAIGQGANDAAMLKTAGLGIAVNSPEGLAIETLLAADIVVPDIYTAFDLILKPVRLVATLRR